MHQSFLLPLPMGKKNGTSWLAIVKRAFRSPTKEEEKKISRRREEPEQEEEEKVIIFTPFFIASVACFEDVFSLGLCREERKEDGFFEGLTVIMQNNLQLHQRSLFQRLSRGTQLQWQQLKPPWRQPKRQ